MIRANYDKVITAVRLWSVREYFVGVTNNITKKRTLKKTIIIIEIFHSWNVDIKFLKPQWENMWLKIWTNQKILIILLELQLFQLKFNRFNQKILLRSFSTRIPIVQSYIVLSVKIISYFNIKNKTDFPSLNVLCGSISCINDLQ